MYFVCRGCAAWNLWPVACLPPFELRGQGTSTSSTWKKDIGTPFATLLDPRTVCCSLHAQILSSCALCLPRAIYHDDGLWVTKLLVTMIKAMKWILIEQYAAAKTTVLACSFWKAFVHLQQIKGFSIVWTWIILRWHVIPTGLFARDKCENE